MPVAIGRKPIEDSGTAGRHRGQYRQSGRTLRDAREGKAASYVDDIHLPTEPPKLLDDAPVIAITSSRDTEITRHGECNAGVHWLETCALYGSSNGCARCDGFRTMIEGF